MIWRPNSAGAINNNELKNIQFVLQSIFESLHYARHLLPATVFVKCG